MNRSASGSSPRNPVIRRLGAWVPFPSPRPGRTLARALLAAVPVLLVAGCASAPRVSTEAPAIELPAAWSAAPADTGLSSRGWWRDFSDPRLDDLVTEALGKNRDLGAAAARVDRAAAQARIAGADLYPALDAQFSASRRKQNFIGLPIPGADGGVRSSLTDTYSPTLQLSWELDLWGRVRSGRSAALADLQAGVADYEGALLSVAGQTVKAAFAATEARLQLELAEASAESYRTTEGQVRERFETGLRTSLDLRLAASNRATAEASVEQRRRQLDAAQRRLEILLGRYPAAALAPAPDLPDLPGPVPAGLPSELVSRRPDLAAAERRLAAAGARVNQSRASLYPRISLTASGGTSSNELSDLLDNDFSVWSLVGNLVQPLFSGGRLRGQVAVSRAQQEEALQMFASDLLQAYSEVEVALAAERFLAEEEQRVIEAEQQAGAAQQVAEEQYRSGLVDFVTVLEAQRSALAARSRLINLRRARLDNRVDLHLALGGGFAVAGNRAQTLEHRPATGMEATTR